MRRSGLEIVAVLARNPGKFMKAKELRDATGMGTSVFHFHLYTMVDKHKISRERLPKSVGNAFSYYLTEAQLAEYKQEVSSARMRLLINGELPPAAPAEKPAAKADKKPADVVVIPSANAMDLVARLAYLRGLRDRSIFGQDAMLAQIIRDYEMALAVRAAEEPRRHKRAA